MNGGLESDREAQAYRLIYYIYIGIMSAFMNYFPNFQPYLSYDIEIYSKSRKIKD
jgi:hypothetical protein